MGQNETYIYKLGERIFKYNFDLKNTSFVREKLTEYPGDVRWLFSEFDESGRLVSAHGADLIYSGKISKFDLAEIQFDFSFKAQMPNLCPAGWEVMYRLGMMIHIELMNKFNENLTDSVTNKNFWEN